MTGRKASQSDGEEQDANMEIGEVAEWPNAAAS